MLGERLMALSNRTRALSNGEVVGTTFLIETEACCETGWKAGGAGIADGQLSI